MSNVNEDNERTKTKKIGGKPLHGNGCRRLDANAGANVQVRTSVKRVLHRIESCA